MTEIHTKYLFIRLLQELDCDLVLDVGSRDGAEALLFKRACPDAAVIALEANPYNYQAMSRDPDLRASDIHLVPYAVWNRDGEIPFYVAAPGPHANAGVSSLLHHPDLAVAETVDVPCVRLDTFLKGRDYQRIAVWMDVEGVEYEALEGLLGCRDRVALIHAEVSSRPMRVGQQLCYAVDTLLRHSGFKFIGSDFDGRFWGNVLYTNRRYPVPRGSWLKARLLRLFPRRRLASFLYLRLPRLHRWLKRRFRASPVLSGY